MKILDGKYKKFPSKNYKKSSCSSKNTEDGNEHKSSFSNQKVNEKKLWKSKMVMAISWISLIKK